jgi:molybdopterin/thiamine biosynthesis adenylyltransferase/rhodanese-related sulfurtransferase
LGSPLAMYLAAAGVGRLGLVDFDIVDETNLQRQLLHGTGDVGRAKLDSAKDRIHDINPNVQVDLHPIRLSSENALALVADYDLVADGTDNFPTRYLVNDACVLTGKPNVYASIFRFEGQITVFGVPNGPCYRCLYEEPPPPGLVPSCAEGGVLGVLPGIVGTIQATEVIKQIVGIGEPLAGRLLLLDALNMRFRELKLRRNPDCVLCGDHPTQTSLIDYELFCGIPTHGAAQEVEDEVDEISVLDLKQRIDEGVDQFILDVRKPFEYDISNLNGHLIPVDDLPERLQELSAFRTTPMVVHCRTGVRSAKAVKILEAAGFTDAVNLKGGINAWSEEVDPSMPTY